MKNLLLNIKEESNSKLMDEVIDIVLDETDGTNEGVKTYLENVMAYGCQSGVVSSLTYYKDTGDFFSRHFDEIFDIINENEFKLEELSSNELAWLGFEYMAQQLYEMVV